MKKIASLVARIATSCAVGTIAGFALSEYRGRLIYKILALLGFTFIGMRLSANAANDAEILVDEGREIIRDLKED